MAEAIGARAPVRARRFRGEVYARHASDALRLALGGLVVALATRAVHPDRVGRQETNVFRLVNDLPLPGWAYPFIWFMMQLGNLGAVPLVAVAAAATRRWRLALDAAVAGGAIYVVARLIKQFVQRGRPQTLLDGVHILGEPARGLGYVSGHSAVAVALATVASPYLGRRARRVAWAGALVVCLARMYVGAHLPLDVLGGAALGWAAGALVHLALGTPRGRPSLAPVRRALDRYGLDPVDLEPVEPVSRRSAGYCATSRDRPDLFVKVVPRERPDGDLLWRAWRWLRSLLPVPFGTLLPVPFGTPRRASGRRASGRRASGRRASGRRASEGAEEARAPRPGPPLQQLEHEASMGLFAAAAGVRAPAVVLVGSFGNGAGLLVEHRVAGRSLERLPATAVDDALLAEAWRQVAVLHRAGIAHCDLDPAAFVVDGRGLPWLVDYDRAQAAAGDRLLDRDVASLLAGLALAVDAGRVAAAARRALGPEAVDRAVALLGSRDLPAAVRRGLRAHPEVRERLAG